MAHTLGIVVPPFIVGTVKPAPSDTTRGTAEGGFLGRSGSASTQAASCNPSPSSAQPTANSAACACVLEGRLWQRSGCPVSVMSLLKSESGARLDEVSRALLVMLSLGLGAVAGIFLQAGLMAMGPEDEVPLAWVLVPGASAGVGFMAVGLGGGVARIGSAVFGLVTAAGASWLLTGGLSAVGGTRPA